MCSSILYIRLPTLWKFDRDFEEAELHLTEALKLAEKSKGKLLFYFRMKY
jgi:hypothetical protein